MNSFRVSSPDGVDRTCSQMSTTTTAETALPWVNIIVPKRGLFQIPWRSLWAYRDLIWLLGLRDISASYKQTVLGPLWFVLQPVLTTATFSFLFGRMADFGTDHIPHPAFYMCGLIIWNYFADCVNKTSLTFSRNSQLFGKVYFPRLAVPLSTMFANLLSFAVQFGLLALVIIYYLVQDFRPHTGPFEPSHIMPNWRMALLPLLILQTAMLALGIGCIVSSLTTRYKDLAMGVGFGVQLWMYGSSIIFPLSQIHEAYRWIFYCNPMVSVVEGFRLALLGRGLVDGSQIALSFAASGAILAVGLMMFNRVEQTVMDTV
jgi:lipopolysaccharide transport system permease protein